MMVKRIFLLLAITNKTEANAIATATITTNPNKWGFWSNNLLSITKKKNRRHTKVHIRITWKKESCVCACMRSKAQTMTFTLFIRFVTMGSTFCSECWCFFLLLLAALAWNSFDTSIGIGIHLVNFILCLFATRQSQNINTDNIRLLYFFRFLFCSLSPLPLFLDYQNVVNCTVYDEWYILNVYNRKTPKG